MSTTAADDAYAQRDRKRHDRELAEMREAQQRIQLGSALRREIHHLADGAGELADQAASASPLAQRATVRLDARRDLAAELHATATRFDLLPSLRLAELDPADLAALDLSAAAESP